MLPRQHLVEHDPQRVEVAALVDGVHPQRRFGREVGDGSEDRPLEGEPLARAAVADAQRAAAPERDAREAIRRGGDRRHRDLGQAEIDELGDVLRALEDHDVARLDVAVDDANRVRRRQRRGDLPADARGAIRRHRPAALDLVVERPPLDVLEHEEARPVLERAEVGRRRDVGVLHVRAGDGLALEARGELGEVVDPGVEDLDGDPLLQQEVRAAVDGAHPAHRQELVDAVALRDHPPDGRRCERLGLVVELGLRPLRAVGRRVVHACRATVLPDGEQRKPRVSSLRKRRARGAAGRRRKPVCSGPSAARRRPLCGARSCDSVSVPSS